MSAAATTSDDMDVCAKVTCQSTTLMGDIIDKGTFCTVRAIAGRSDIVAKVYTLKHQCARTIRAIASIDKVSHARASSCPSTSTTETDDSETATLAHYRTYIEEVRETGAIVAHNQSTGRMRITLYVIMPKYDINFGKYLREYVRSNDTGLPACITLKLARELFGALCVLEHAHIIHGDIKPSNIMVRMHGGAAFDLEAVDSYEFVLCDFGSARKLKDGETEYHPAIVGTNGYMAPEIMLGMAYSFPADIWSAMTTIMTSIIGCEIFDATNHDDMIYGSNTDGAFANTWDVDGESEDEDTATEVDSRDSDHSHDESKSESASDSFDASGVEFAQMYAMIVEMYAVIGAPPVAFCTNARAFYNNGLPRYHTNMRSGSVSAFIGNNCTMNPQHARSIGEFVSMGLRYMPQDRATASDIVHDPFLLCD